MKPRALEWSREGDCIRCRHSHDTSGYPKITRKGRYLRVARFIVFRRHGELPPSVVTRHTCDNRWCINPSHLLVGTHQDNARDRATRGRNADQRGASNHNAKLTVDQVQYIKKSHKSHSELATQFGVPYHRIYQAKNGKTWKHPAPVESLKAC